MKSVKLHVMFFDAAFKFKGRDQKRSLIQFEKERQQFFARFMSVRFLKLVTRLAFLNVIMRTLSKTRVTRLAALF